jgi:hypothetical protein
LYRLEDAAWSRPTFHISPHALHRQYVDASTFSLADAMFDDRQNGQAAGGCGVGGLTSDIELGSAGRLGRLDCASYSNPHRARSADRIGDKLEPDRGAYAHVAVLGADEIAPMKEDALTVARANDAARTAACELGNPPGRFAAPLGGRGQFSRSHG